MTGFLSLFLYMTLSMVQNIVHHNLQERIWKKIRIDMVGEQISYKKLASMLISFRSNLSRKVRQLVHAGHKKTPAMTRVMPGLHAMDYQLLLDVANALCEQPFGAFLNGELDRLPFGERAEAFHLDFVLVAEQIFAAIVRGDEAKAFGFIEPLYFTLHSILCDFRNGPNALELWAPLITEL